MLNVHIFLSDSLNLKIEIFMTTLYINSNANNIV